MNKLNQITPKTYQSIIFKDKIDDSDLKNANGANANVNGSQIKLEDNFIISSDHFNKFRKSITKDIISDRPIRKSLKEFADLQINEKRLNFNQSQKSELKRDSHESHYSSISGDKKEKGLSSQKSEKNSKLSESSKNKNNSSSNSSASKSPKDKDTNKAKDSKSNNMKSKINKNNPNYKNTTTNNTKKQNNFSNIKDNSISEKKRFTQGGFEYKTYGVNENRLFTYLKEITKNSQGKFLDYKNHISNKTIDEFPKQEGFANKSKKNQTQNYYATLKTKNSLNSCLNFGQSFKSARNVNGHLNQNDKDIFIKNDYDAEKEINAKTKNNKNRNNLNIHLNKNVHHSNFPEFSNEIVMVYKNSRNPFVNTKNSLIDIKTEDFPDNFNLLNFNTAYSRNFLKNNSSLDFKENTQHKNGIFN
jgi:hypothetical protein